MKQFIQRIILTVVLVVMGRVSAEESAAKGPDLAKTPPSSNPRFLTVFKDAVYFSADDGAHGDELWVTDGTATGTRLVSDVIPGPESSLPHSLQPCPELLLFTAKHARGNELYSTDGTTSKTGLVPGLKSRFADRGTEPMFLGATSKWAYFSIDTPEYGRELFRSDGREITLIKDLIPGTTSSTPGYSSPVFPERRAQIVGDGLYFLAFWRMVEGKGLQESGLWKCSAEDRIEFVASLAEDTTNLSEPYHGRVFFCSSDDAHGHELWVTDGTAAGTHLFLDINPGKKESYPSDFHLFNDRLYFAADDGANGKELWISDGTPEGTKLLYDIFPGPGQSFPGCFTESGGRLFFLANNGVDGNEPWIIDKTPDRIRLLKNIYPGLHDSNPYQLCDVNGILFFAAPDGVHGEELWRSDGTESGTYMVKDINPGPAFSEPYNLVSYHGFLLFGASDPIHGRELWRSDGTEKGTELVRDIYREQFVNPSSAPSHLTPAGDRLFFVANDLLHGAELWVLNTSFPNTPASLVRDIFPGSASSSPEELTAVGSTVFFRADDGVHGAELWVSDGTERGTIMLNDIREKQAGSCPRELTVFKDGVMFAADDGVRGEELWWANATRVERIHDINPGPASSHPRDLRVWRNKVYFRANDGIHGEELWVCDGTAQGTSMVLDLAPTPIAGASIREITPGAHGVYFIANDGVSGQALWRTDGTFPGTQRWVDLLPSTGVHSLLRR